VRRYAITLMTRPYGRGTDFVCRDEGLRMNGGVHLIITFFPEHESEMKQIIGRTCRQDDPGSARMVLFEDDLAYLNASETKKVQARVDCWTEYLGQCRQALETVKSQAMKENHEEFHAKHIQTLEACKAVQNKDWESAAGHFLCLNAEPKSRTLPGGASGSVDVCFVMDCTGSMGCWIKACKERVICIASQIKQIISEQGHAAKVRMAFVGYRDYKDDGLTYDEAGINVCPFTEDVEVLKSFVGNEVASGGGEHNSVLHWLCTNVSCSVLC
jgi:hypothetical protein